MRPLVTAPKICAEADGKTSLVLTDGLLRPTMYELAIRAEAQRAAAASGASASTKCHANLRCQLHFFFGCRCHATCPSNRLAASNAALFCRAAAMPVTETSVNSGSTQNPQAPYYVQRPIARATVLQPSRLHAAVLPPPCLPHNPPSVNGSTAGIQSAEPKGSIFRAETIFPSTRNAPTNRAETRARYAYCSKALVLEGRCCSLEQEQVALSSLERVKETLFLFPCAAMLLHRQAEQIPCAPWSVQACTFAGDSKRAAKREQRALPFWLCFLQRTCGFLLFWFCTRGSPLLWRCSRRPSRDFCAVPRAEAPCFDLVRAPVQ